MKTFTIMINFNPPPSVVIVDNSLRTVLSDNIKFTIFINHGNKYFETHKSSKVVETMIMNYLEWTKLSYYVI